MYNGGRRKVWICTQQARENKRFIKKVAKAVLPSKRTERAIMQSLFSSPSSAHKSTYSETRTNPNHKKSPLKWSNVKPTKFQWIGCIAVSSICTYPVFASGSLDRGNGAFGVLFFFFVIPLFTSFLVVLNYNGTKYRSDAHNSKAKEPQPAESTSATFVENKDGDYEIAEVNAPLYMAQFKDSLQIMQSTADPSTFFSRFDFAKEKLENMVEYERLGIPFTGSPSFILEQLQDESNIADTINVLVDNSYKKQFQKITSLKTERGRSNSNQRWYTSFEPYFDRMPTRSKKYLDLKLAELQEV